MGDLTPHFSVAEFRCRDGSTRDMCPRLLAMLEAIRVKLERPITITSGYRSPKHNAKVKGAPKSYHVRGMAADFKVQDMDTEVVYALVDRIYPECGLGLYLRESGGWIHLDSRRTRARWRG